jgi:alpha-ketoglutarate-dependent taurine dioxygenase
MNLKDITQTVINEQGLPLIIAPKQSKHGESSHLIKWLQQENTFFKKQLLQHGALFFRGFNVNTPELFKSVIHACDLGGLYIYDYCNVPRSKIMEGIYTSVAAYMNVAIPMHNEKSYDPDFPDTIYFNCITPASIGGHTLLLNGHQLWNALPKLMQKKFETKGIRYSRYYYGQSLLYSFIKKIAKQVHYPTWMKEFRTQNKDRVEKMLHEAHIDFKWVKSGNGLITEIQLPAMRFHPVTKKPVWFNQCSHNNAYDNHTLTTINRTVKNPLARWWLSQRRFLPHMMTFGDGEAISQEESHTINQAIKTNTCSVPWEQGDIMVVDNYSCMHGKSAHKGQRLILAAMTKP